MIFYIYLKTKRDLGMVVYACNSSTGEGEAEYHELEATL